MKTERTCAECIELVLKRGGRWRNEQIKAAILQYHGAMYQNNTIAKYLSFFMKKGAVRSNPVKTSNGKMCDEYWFVPNSEKPASIITVIDKCNFEIEELMDNCLEMARTYPEDHPQVAEIMNQYHRLETKQRRTA
jgi:hypothetical protein